MQEEEEIINHLSKSYDKETIVDLFHNSLEIYNKIENYELLHSQQIPKVDVKNYPKIDLLHC